MRGYGEVTWNVHNHNALTTNERLTFLTSLRRNSPADTFITALVLQEYIVHGSSSRDKHHFSRWWTKDGWDDSCCSFLMSTLLLHTVFPPAAITWQRQSTLKCAPLFLTGCAAVQSRVENGNTNPLVLCEPLRHARSDSHPVGDRLQITELSQPVLQAGSWCCLVDSDVVFFCCFFKDKIDVTLLQVKRLQCNHAKTSLHHIHVSNLWFFISRISINCGFPRPRTKLSQRN